MAPKRQRSSASRSSTRTATARPAPSSLPCKRSRGSMRQPNGRDIKIHGVNLSVGYPFEPEWFACGHSPLARGRPGSSAQASSWWCRPGTRATAGNRTSRRAPRAAGLDVTINDPGNAEQAITVGATHREHPDTLRGLVLLLEGTDRRRSTPSPTSVGAGRTPPLLPRRPQVAFAPAGQPKGGLANYSKDSGTSMAAPHVSGSSRRSSSVRTEFIGQPERVKQQLHVDRDRPASRSPLSGSGPRGSNASNSSPSSKKRSTTVIMPELSGFPERRDPIRQGRKGCRRPRRGSRPRGGSLYGPDRHVARLEQRRP